jgi:glycerol-3-phosphate acyltransferase PlsY
MFSPFLGFKGGKGVATSLGVVLAIAWFPMLVVFLLGLGIIFSTGYVSLASITGASLLPFLILAFQWSSKPWISFAVTFMLGVMIVWKHRSNIARLRAGTEKRIIQKNGSRRPEARIGGNN